MTLLVLGADPSDPVRTALEEACRGWAARQPTQRDWRLERAQQDLLLVLAMDGTATRLVVSQRGRGKAWAETPSLAVSFKANGPIAELSPRVEAAVRELVDAIRARDDGTLCLRRSTTRTTERANTRGVDGLGRDGSGARRQHAAHERELHFAAFVAWKAASTEDLYPHISQLGVPVSPSEILSGWEDCVHRIRTGRAPRKLGLYVHVPFCGVACTFCYCAKTDRFERTHIDSYVDELVAEIELYRPVFEGVSFSSIYFGGGTPSMLSPSAMERLFATLYAAFDVPAGTQMVFEGNPDSLNDRKIEILANVGRVTRLTIGVQTLDPEAQRRARRFNKPERVAAAVESARRWGIPHVNLDFMAGLDGQTFEAFQNDVRFAVSLQPDSLHLNGFRPTPFTGFAQSGARMTHEQLQLRDRMLEWGNAVLEDTGFQLGLEGSRTQNAVNIQEYDLRRQNSSLLGLGYPARSHSFANHYYLPDIDAGIDLGLKEHLARRKQLRAVRVDEREEAHKYLVENIRTGFEVAEFRQLFGCEPWQAASRGWPILEELGVVASDGERVHVDSGGTAFALIYRWFLYSPTLQARAREIWGVEYDPSADYWARLRILLEASDDPHADGSVAS